VTGPKTTGWVALLRGVNVGGVKVEMARLKALGEAAGFSNVRTFIASGNLVFASDAGEAAIKATLEAAIEAEFGRKIGVLVRSADELADVLERNPFAAHPGNYTVAIFVDTEPSLDGVRHQADEELKIGKRAIYGYYPSGQGRSKLVIPAAKAGTARNMNTVAKLAEMAKEAAG